MSVGTRQYGYSYSQSQASYLPRVGDILRATLLLAQTRLVRSRQTNTQDTKNGENLRKIVEHYISISLLGTLVML